VKNILKSKSEVKKMSEIIESKNNKYYTHVHPKLDVIKAWCREGHTEDVISKKLGITRQTLYAYKNKYNDLAEAMRMGKEDIDYEVENALLQAALGHTVREVHKVTDPEGNVTTKEIVKEVSPNVRAQMFWLKNRKLGQWKDKIDQDNIEAEINISIIKE